MKEKPMLFNGEMVRAILDGRKTQTRRVVKGVRNDNCIKSGRRTVVHVLDAVEKGHCPYGAPEIVYGCGKRGIMMTIMRVKTLC